MLYSGIVLELYVVGAGWYRAKWFQAGLCRGGCCGVERNDEVRERMDWKILVRESVEPESKERDGVGLGCCDECCTSGEGGAGGCIVG